MTGSDITGDVFISGATINLLKDAGKYSRDNTFTPWYDVENIMDDTNWGKHKGCDFLNKGC